MKDTKIPVDADVAGIDHSRQVLTADEAAQFLRVRKAELYNLVRQDAVPYRRVGKRYLRFWREDLEEFMSGEMEG